MNAFWRGIALVALSATVAACGGGQSAPAAPAGSAGAQGEAQGGIDVKAMMARESQGLAPRKLSAQGVRAEVLSSADPKLVLDQGRAKVVIPIGAEADVHCMLYEQDPLPGSTFVNIVESMKKEFEVQQLTRDDMELVKEAPVTKLSMVYATPTQAGKALNQLKLAFHFRLGSSSLCMHDELGYEKTFAAVARSFFETLERRGPSLDASYVEIFAGEINDRPAGYDRNLVFLDAGKRKLLSMSLLMVQSGPAEIMAQDSSSVIAVDAQDHVERGHWIETQNGALSLDVELARLEQNRYRYAGTRRGGRVEGELRTRDPLGLPSSLWTQKELKRRLAKPAPFALSLEQYRPDDDPAAVSWLEIARRTDDPPRAIRIKVKDAEAMSLVDEQGRDRRSEVVVAGARVVLDRTYERGE